MYITGEPYIVFTRDRILMWKLITDDDMITTLFPVDPDPDLEVEEQTSQTWHIQDWKKLEKKVYWPTFECGGSTWYVLTITPRPKISPFLKLCTGEFSCIRPETAWISCQCTSKQAPRQKRIKTIGMPVPSLQQSCGTRGSHRNMFRMVSNFSRLAMICFLYLN